MVVAQFEILSAAPRSPWSGLAEEKDLWADVLTRRSWMLRPFAHAHYPDRSPGARETPINLPFWSFRDSVAEARAFRSLGCRGTLSKATFRWLMGSPTRAPSSLSLGRPQRATRRMTDKNETAALEEARGRAG